MRGAMNRGSRLIEDRRGVSSIEYALLGACILLLAAFGYRLLGKNSARSTTASAQVLLGGNAPPVGGAGGAGPGSGGAGPGSGSAGGSGGATPGGGSGGGGGNAGGGGGNAGGPLASNDAHPPVNTGPVICDGHSCGVPGGNCFVAGTPVWTPTGERRIEDITRGDMVLSRDEATGDVHASRVTRTFTRGAASLVDVVLASEDGRRDRVRVTPEHPFWTRDRGWTSARELTAEEALLDAEGHEVHMVSRTELPMEATVYNFEVEQTHTYFVGHLGAWVHNACDPIRPVFNGLTGASIPNVGTQIIINSFNNGSLPQSGVGSFNINPQTGAITPAQPTLFGPPTFSGQYVGLLTPPNGQVPHTLDPNASVVFTDNLTGCSVAITQTSPPQLLHMLAQDLYEPPYNGNVQQFMTAHGVNPNGDPAHGIPPPLLVNANDYGWVIGGGDYGPGMNQPHNSQAFLYGVTDPSTGQRTWWLLNVGRTPGQDGYTQTTTFVGTTRP